MALKPCESRNACTVRANSGCRRYKMSKKQELVNAVGAIAEMAWIFYMATRDAGADVTEAALLTRQYQIATMHGKDRDTTEDDNG